MEGFSFNRLASVGRKLLRQKKIEENSLGSTKLDRCLSTFDLTALGKRKFSISKTKKVPILSLFFTKVYISHRLV